MQSLKDILGVRSPAKQISPLEYEQQRCDRYNSGKGSLTGIDCPKCKNKGDIAFVSTDLYPSMAIKPCECMKVRRSIWNIEQSGLKDKLKGCTFDTFNTGKPFQKEMKTKAEGFVTMPDGWFFLGGQVGCGKTHICTAICGEFLKQYKTVRYMLWREDVVSLKALVTDAEEYKMLIDKFKRAEVLYIDDFFKVEKGKKPTAADVNVAFEIIDYRYRNRDLITIISSEMNIYDLLDIDEAVGSRIYERCKNINIDLEKSENYRLRSAT